jgi:ribonuclease HI
VNRHWVLYTDGGSRGNPGPAGSGFVLFDSSGARVCAAGHFLGEATNNRAEYDGLVRGLSSAVSRGCRSLEVRMDSELIVRQMTGRYRVKNEGLKEPFARAKTLAARVDRVRFMRTYPGRRTPRPTSSRTRPWTLAVPSVTATMCVGMRTQGTLF